MVTNLKEDKQVLTVPRFRIAKGDETLKEELFAMLNFEGNETGGLRQFLKSLGKIEDLTENWWVAIDRENAPLGALSAVYYRGTTYFKSMWYRPENLDNQVETSKVLLEAWLKEKYRGIKYYQADLSLFSPLRHIIEFAGFNKEKLLHVTYDVDTDWTFYELPEGYVMRAPNLDELGDIYDLLVAPDLDESSAIYISRKQFMAFPKQLPKQSLDSWVVVENEHSALVGFGASFPGREKGETIAVLYGPHATESSVLRSILAETMTFWKTKNIDKMRILRTSEYYDSVLRAFADQNMTMINSVTRFSMMKRR